MRAPATFRQADVVRAWRAAKAAGVEHPRIEILPDGRIVVSEGAPLVPEPPPVEPKRKIVL